MEAFQLLALIFGKFGSMHIWKIWIDAM